MTGSSSAANHITNTAQRYFDYNGNYSKISGDQWYNDPFPSTRSYSYASANNVGNSHERTDRQLQRQGMAGGQALGGMQIDRHNSAFNAASSLASRSIQGNVSLTVPHPNAVAAITTVAGDISAVNTESNFLIGDNRKFNTGAGSTISKVTGVTGVTGVASVVTGTSGAGVRSRSMTGHLIFALYAQY